MYEENRNVGWKKCYFNKMNSVVYSVQDQYTQIEKTKT